MPTTQHNARPNVLQRLLGRAPDPAPAPLRPWPPARVDAEIVRWGYRLLLDREPENAEAIDRKLAFGSDIRGLRLDFLLSDEFRAKHGLSIPTLNGNEGPLQIDKVESPADLQTIFDHVQKTWSTLGEAEPHFSVCTHEQFLQKHLATNRADFYATGKSEAALVRDMLARVGVAVGALKTCLEYGCGVGRVTRSLADMFEHVDAYDISAAHLRYAAEYLTADGLKNVALHHVTKVHDAPLARADFVYSIIVLQHNPPPIIAVLLRRLLQALNPGGVALIQVPTYRVGYRFSLPDYLASLSQPTQMEMHVFPQRDVFQIVDEENARVLEVLEDGRVGCIAGFVSNSFIIRKRRDTAP